jgi:hypothetical protein
MEGDSSVHRRMIHAKKQRRKENREPVCVMLGAERWVSRSVVHRSNAIVVFGLPKWF